MAKARKLTASERDGVQYNRAKRWQIMMAMGSNSTAMAFSSLLGLISYLANSGYGIMVAAVGMVLTACRVFDGVVDPFLALLIDRVNTRFGKIRLFMSIGFLIRTVAVYMLYIWGSGRFGMPFFIVMYLLYILGNSIGDVAGNMITPILTNDPSQRPFVGFWGMVHSALSAMVFGLVITLVILPQYGNQYNNEMLAASCVVYVGIAFFFFVMSMIGVAAHDKPENFRNIKEGEVGFKDMLSLVKDNRPFQMYTIAAVTDKIATQARPGNRGHYAVRYFDGKRAVWFDHKHCCKSAGDIPDFYWCAICGKIRRAQRHGDLGVGRYCLCGSRCVVLFAGSDGACPFNASSVIGTNSAAVDERSSKAGSRQRYDRNRADDGGNVAQYVSRIRRLDRGTAEQDIK